MFVPTLADKPISTHSRAKAAGTNKVAVKSPPIISTHSRAKAAGSGSVAACGRKLNFNSQPREGGWAK